MSGFKSKWMNSQNEGVFEAFSNDLPKPDKILPLVDAKVLDSSETSTDKTDKSKTWVKPTLYLPATMLESLMVWTVMYHELRITHPAGLTINAKPEHVRNALETHAWGVVHFSDEGGRWLLLSWGNVPTHALMGLRDLDTGALLASEQVAA